MGFKNYYFKEDVDGVSYSSVEFHYPQKINNAIIEYAAENIKDSYIYEDKDDPSYGRVSYAHTTLLYGIKDNKDRVQDLAKNIKPFNVKFGKINFFEANSENDAKCDVVYVEVLPAQTPIGLEENYDILQSINRYFRENLNHISTHDIYVPHATLAYVKKGSAKKLQKELDLGVFEGVECQLQDIYYSNSDNEKHQIPILY